MPLPELASLLSCLSTADIANFQFVFAADAHNPFHSVLLLIILPFASVIAGTQVSAADLSKV